MSVANPVIDYIDAVASPRLIYLRSDVTEYHPVEDIYKEVRHLRRTNEALRPYDVFVTAQGNIAKGGNKFTPRFAVFEDSKIVVTSENVKVLGEQLIADATGAFIGSGLDIIDREASLADAYVDYTPAEAEIIVVTTTDAEVTLCDHISDLTGDLEVVQLQGDISIPKLESSIENDLCGELDVVLFQSNNENTLSGSLSCC